MDKKSYTFDEIKQKLVNYCVYQDRCHYEVAQKMREFLLIEEAKEEILMYLIRENYLNEERYTRSYIRGKFYIKHWGKNKIKQHLKIKQIPSKLIDRCMDEIHEEDYANTIRKIAENYWKGVDGKNDFERKSKTIRYLVQKGFEYDVVMGEIADLDFN